MNKRTKIIATLGPATDDKNVIRNMLLHGVNAVRINCSHGSHEIMSRRVRLVRTIAKELDLIVAIIFDLQGRKSRIGSFSKNKIQLKKQQKFILDCYLDKTLGNENTVSISNDLYENVSTHDQLMLNDSKIILEIKQKNAGKLYCEVITGGELSNNKGINKFGGGFINYELTAKDKLDLELACKLKVDFIALSFVNNEQNLHQVRDYLKQYHANCQLIAKIEVNTALQNIKSIIHASDMIMIARGDLGIEIGEEKLPFTQKKLILDSILQNKPTIVATQLMESMVNQNNPTKAEIFDVANAILDGADTLMLTSETAVANNPVNVVKKATQICINNENHDIFTDKNNILQQNHKLKRTDEAIALATMFTANRLNVTAIVVLTETGMTATWMSRINSNIPIYACSQHHDTCRKLTLIRGVEPIYFNINKYTETTINEAILQYLRDKQILMPKQWLILVRGDILGMKGQCNTMKILQA